MKIIFSRKGWDSTAGGKPSPIFEGSGFSLPIPDGPPNPICYRNLAPNAVIKHYPNLDSFLQVYAPKSARTEAHLDPDLDHSIYPRSKDWTPCFGQDGAAASHLDNQKVKKDDIFIFYGWFDDVNMKTLQRLSNDRFCVFGYLQIGQILNNPLPATTPSWLHYHPHFSHRNNYNNNRIYIAKQSVTFPPESGISLPSLSGGGILNPAVSSRCLTKNLGKRGLHPSRLLSSCSTMTKHRQEHVWQPTCPNDWAFVASLLV